MMPAEKDETDNIPRTGVSKKSILDILAKTDVGTYIVVELQVDAFEFIVERSALHSAEILVRQYSVEDNQRKNQIKYREKKSTQ